MNIGLLLRYQELLDLQRKAAEAEKLFEAIAWEIARERDEMASGEHLVFEEKVVKFSCRGTGTASHEEWYEEFPVELLLERAATLRGL